MPKFKDDGNNIEVGIPKAEAQSPGQITDFWTNIKTLCLLSLKLELAFRQAHSTSYSQLSF